MTASVYASLNDSDGESRPKSVKALSEAGKSLRYEQESGGDQRLLNTVHSTSMMMGLGLQVAWLLVLSIPVACIAWTVTHEEVFREPRQYCQKECARAKGFAPRKFFYLFTCEYCFSHYVAAGVLVVARFKMLFPDWRGWFVALFALVWIANQYMSIYNHLRLDIKGQQVEIKATEQKVSERVEDRKAA